MENPCIVGTARYDHVQLWKQLFFLLRTGKLSTRKKTCVAAGASLHFSTGCLPSANPLHKHHGQKVLWIGRIFCLERCYCKIKLYLPHIHVHCMIQGEGKFDGKTFAPPKTPPVRSSWDLYSTATHALISSKECSHRGPNESAFQHFQGLPDRGRIS